MQPTTVIHHLDDTNSIYILSEYQFGFKSHHSCKLQLFITIDNFANAINNRQQIDVGILDFAKAYMIRSHILGCYIKLECYRVIGNLLS